MTINQHSKKFSVTPKLNHVSTSLPSTRHGSRIWMYLKCMEISSSGAYGNFPLSTHNLRLDFCSLPCRFPFLFRQVESETVHVTRIKRWRNFFQPVQLVVTLLGIQVGCITQGGGGIGGTRESRWVGTHHHWRGALLWIMWIIHDKNAYQPNRTVLIRLPWNFLISVQLKF